MDGNVFDAVHSAFEQAWNEPGGAQITADAFAASPIGQKFNQVVKDFEKDALTDTLLNLVAHIGPMLIGVGIFALGGLMLAMSFGEDFVDVYTRLSTQVPPIPVAP